MRQPQLLAAFPCITAYLCPLFLLPCLHGLYCMGPLIAALPACHPPPHMQRHPRATCPHATACIQVCAALFEPPPFQPSKLDITMLAGSRATRAQPGTVPPSPRRYTLTHNDLTGALRLSIGSDFNARQMGGFYTRLLRDEVTAEWDYSAPGGPVLNVHCHVSGQERWLAPPRLRNYIFRREMALVRSLGLPLGVAIRGILVSAFPLALCAPARFWRVLGLAARSLHVCPSTALLCPPSHFCMHLPCSAGRRC